MAELPILPLKTDALLADTSHMSASEFGAYVRILLVMWRHGGKLPDDDEELARIAGVPPSRWRQMAQKVRRPLTSAGGVLSQKRLTDTWLRVQEKRRKRADAANTRWGNPIEEGTGPPGMQVHMQSISTCNAKPNQNLKTKPSESDSEPSARQRADAFASLSAQKRQQNQQNNPAGGRATALGGGAPAHPPESENASSSESENASVTNPTPPHLATRADLEAAFAAKRKPRKG
jgi:uncharacterized protein YdaU (DUF1376 family)